jgi:twitching motility two-component system response regulator PilH
MSATILIADSDRVLQQAVATRMTAAQIQTVCADDGNEALCLLNETTPDLLIAQIALPDKNGYSLCRYVRGEPEFHSMPVVLIDSRFDASNRSLAYNSGANAYICEPLEPDELIKVVRSLLESKRGYNVGPISEVLGGSRRPVFVQGGHGSEGSDIADNAGQITPARQPYEGKVIPISPPEAAPSHPRKRRRLVLCSMAIATILVAAGLTILRRTDTSSIPATRQESSADEAGQRSADALEGQRAGLTPRREMPFTISGATPAPQGKEAMEAGQSAGAEAPQTRPPGSSKGQAAASHAETARSAPRQSPALPPERKDLPAAKNVPAYTPVARPRGVRSIRPTTIGGHLKRSGREMKEAGEHFVSGVEHFGKSGGKSASWAGRKVGGGVRRMGAAIRKIF